MTKINPDLLIGKEIRFLDNYTRGKKHHPKMFCRWFEVTNWNFRNVVSSIEQGERQWEIRDKQL